MISTVKELQDEFDGLLRKIKGQPTARFAQMVEVAFEAVICAKTITEYVSIYGQVRSIRNPTYFLNQKPGRLKVEKSFIVEFSDAAFVFATDVECYGLFALTQLRPAGDMFEADVVVIKAEHLDDVIDKFGGYPAPQHLSAAYECKFGSYHKAQLRELLGLRRHLCFIGSKETANSSSRVPFRLHTTNATPAIQIILFRPMPQSFFSTETATLYDLHQEVYL